MQDFRKLDVWNLAHQLTLDVYHCSREFPRDELFGLTSQLRRSCVSIEANLAEGCGRGSDVDFGRFVQMAMGSACEVECHLQIAKDLGYLPATAHEHLHDRVQRVKRMVASLLRKLKSCTDLQ
jgi:four helix bundle protein